KNNKFAVLKELTDEFVEVTRKRGEPIVPPAKGKPALINPREEDPLEFLEIDLLGTFYFLPKSQQGSKEYQRAKYTIEILRLNERDYLQVARQGAYKHYRAHLIEYINKRDAGDPEKELQALINFLKGMQHPTVWQEMKRQRTLIPELAML